jgi:hypothetical protein
MPCLVFFAMGILACRPPDGSLGDNLSSSSTSDGTGEGSESGGTDESDSGETDGGIPKFDTMPPQDFGEPDPPPEFPTTCAEAEDNPSSVGCEFYPLALNQSFNATGSTGFAASNASANPATVTLSDINGQIDQRVIQPGDFHMFVVDSTHHLEATTEVTEHGFVIDSDEVLQVYAFIPPISTVTADATIVLPRTALGHKHRAVTYNDFNGSSPDGIHGEQYVSVVAVEDDTEVFFELAAPGSATLAGSVLPALEKKSGEDNFSVVLDRLETLTIAADNQDPVTEAYNVELTGSLIRSDKPIAAYSGNPPVGVPAKFPWPCCADLIATNLPPTTTWGTQYAAVKLYPIDVEPDVWRFIGNRDDTEIELTGGVDDLIVIDEGEFFDLETPESFWAAGNHAFGMVHFMPGADMVEGSLQTYDGPSLSNPGDPAMVWVYPAGSWLNRYLFPVGPVTGGEWLHDHVNIVAPLADWDDVTLGGNPLPAATELTDTMGYVRVPVPDPIYELLAPPGVGVEVTVYGYVHNGSYLYPGGMGLGKLNPPG